MPDPNAVAPETDVEEQDVVADEPETVASARGSVADKTDDEGGAEGGEADETQKRIDEAVGKALAAQASKLAEARKDAESNARTAAEARFYKEEVERLRNPKKEDIGEGDVKLPEGMDLLPEATQKDYLETKRMLRELAKETKARGQDVAQIRNEIRAEFIDSTIESMKSDEDNFPGFKEVYPQIEEMGRTDPQFLAAVRANPAKYLKMAYRDLTAESASTLAEKAYEAKIERQKKAQTTKPTMRDTGVSRKFANSQEAMQDAWKKYGGDGNFE